jgi:hypothetical protein
MRDEVLQLMVWCIGTKKFSAEQIAEASDMISTHARWAAPQQRRTAGQPPALYYQYCEQDPYITRPELFHIALCFIQSNTCLCPPSHLISTNQWNTSWVC